MSKTDDPINPSHYADHPSGIEPINICKHFNFALGNVLKYVMRAGLKENNSKLQDLKKARWYLDYQIKELESQDDG